MLCSINDYFLADGTFSGGYSITNFRIKTERIFDVVIPLGTVDPVLLDRNKRKVDITFSVQRVQATIKAADDFVLLHEATVPRSGNILLIVSISGIVPITPFALVVNGELVSQELIRQIGKFTEHAYHIVGAPIFSELPTDRILMETGDFMLMETSDKMLLE